jgi:predicted transcriptional regulator
VAKEHAVRLALLSVHPEFADALVRGEKLVEFRKRALAADVTHVAIYATKPVGRIVGVFRIRDQVTDTPHGLWAKFKRVAGISQDRFLAYYEGHESGVGIRVEAMIALDESVTLEDAFGISRPPQSVQYFQPTVAGPKLSAALV